MSSDEFEDIPLERPPLKPVFKSAKVNRNSDNQCKGKENRKNKKKQSNAILSFSSTMVESSAAIKKVNLIPEASACDSVGKGERPKVHQANSGARLEELESEVEELRKVIYRLEIEKSDEQIENNILRLQNQELQRANQGLKYELETVNTEMIRALKELGNLKERLTKEETADIETPGHAKGGGTNVEIVAAEEVEKNVADEDGGDTESLSNGVEKQGEYIDAVTKGAEEQEGDIEFFQCKENEKKCKKKFKTKLGLQNHIGRYHVEKKEFACQECDKSFARLHALAAHQKTHLNPTYSCDKCGKIVKHKHHLQQHIAYHHEEVNVKCSVCDKVFLHRVDKTNHNKTCQKKENKKKHIKQKANTEITSSQATNGEVSSDKTCEIVVLDSVVHAERLPSEAGLPGDNSHQTAGEPAAQAHVEGAVGNDVLQVEDIICLDESQMLTLDAYNSLVSSNSDLPVILSFHDF